MAFLAKRKHEEENTSEKEVLEVIDLDLTSEWEKLEQGLMDIREEAPGEASLPTEEVLEEYALQSEVEDVLRQTVMAELTADRGAESMDVEEITQEAAITQSKVGIQVLPEEEFAQASGEEELEQESEEEVELSYLSMEEEPEREAEEEKEESPFIFFERIGEFFARFSALDKVVAGTGILVVIVAIVTLTTYVQKAGRQEQIAAMASVGEQLQTVGTLGADKLLAVADARSAMLLAAQAEEEIHKEYEEKEETQEIQISMKMTSIQKDLKIKFVNKQTGKLISSIPFEVDIIDSKDKKYSKVDEDKDGIIYLKDLEPGNYTVSMVERKELEGYSYSTAQEKIKVKESIEYQKIDVSDEIKDQSEVDVSKEDTAHKQETEAVLQDTVEWVPSRKEEITAKEEYKPVNKTTIADPALSASLTDTGMGIALLQRERFKTTRVNVLQKPLFAIASMEGSEEKVPEEESTAHVKGIQLSATATQLAMGESAQLTAVIEKEGEPSYTIEWSMEENELVALNGSGESVSVTVMKEPQQDSSVNITVNAGGQTASLAITIKGKPQDTTVAVSKIELNSTQVTLEVGKTFELKAEVLPKEAENKNCTWSVNDGNIVKVENGIVTALKEGTAIVTVTAEADSGIKAECTITVTGTTEASTTLKLDKNTASLKPKETLLLKATVTPEGKSIKWQTSKKEVATVDEKGMVTAKAAGEAIITAEADGVRAECKITVSTSYDPKNDNSKALKDKSGKQIYVLVNGNYAEAKVADYYKHSQFYIKESISQYRYYGWQDLDGKTYFFDKNGNMVTGEQVIQGARYKFNSDGSLNTGSGILGIDVSTWNGNINWSQVKNSGVSYVIIRTGFRGSTQGALVEDNKFRQNIKGALDAGLKVGVYFFTQAVNEVEAVEEASMVLSQIKGYKISYPVFIDVESSGGRADGLDSGTRTRVINAFCQTIQNGGYRAGIYANKTWLAQKMNISALSGYKIWLAQYNTHVTYGGRYDMWQYSDKGTVPGISGKVDMNLSYMNY